VVGNCQENVLYYLPSPYFLPHFPTSVSHILSPINYLYLNPFPGFAMGATQTKALIYYYS
jgi:hypothetical protein